LFPRANALNYAPGQVVISNGAKYSLFNVIMAVVPGVSFGVDTHVRLSYACSMADIREGLDRRARFVTSL
jgi:aspartate/methionine/tyrosine aminotransferase